MRKRTAILLSAGALALAILAVVASMHGRAPDIGAELLSALKAGDLEDV